MPRAGRRDGGRLQRGRPRRALSGAGRRGVLHRRAQGRRELSQQIASVISAAEVGNVQAIHPGYGFLAENAHFDEICRSCKIEFIGPTPEAMARLGDKNAARELAREAERAGRARQRRRHRRARRRPSRFAHEIGFPVLIKAAAGGGGRGMRVARTTWRSRSALQPGAGRGRGRLRQRRRVSREIHRAPAARRSAGAGRSSRQRRPPLGARLHAAAAAPEADRGKPQPEHLRRDAHGDVRRGRAAGPGGQLHQCRHGRVPRRQERQLLLHRGQRPHPGRASGDRDGDRHRPHQVADPRGRRRDAAVGRRRTSSSAARRSSAASTPKTRPTTFSPRPARSSS